MARPDLRLHEELVLIALRDDTGTPESKAAMVDFALGGAILSELLLEERVAIAAGKRPLVDVVATQPLHDDVLDEALDRIATAKRRRRVADWVSRFAHLKRLRIRIAQGLCRRGILADSEDRVLLIFKRKAFPTIDPAPERRLVERLRQALASGGGGEPRTVTLLALAHACEMLGVHFDRQTLRRHRKLLRQLAGGSAVAGATREAVEAARAAAVAATVVVTS